MTKECGKFVKILKKIAGLEFERIMSCFHGDLINFNRFLGLSKDLKYQKKPKFRNLKFFFKTLINIHHKL